MGWTRWVIVPGVTLLALWLSATAALAVPGQAEMRVNAPSAPQSVSTSFDVTVAITRADVTWAGYSMQLAYDTNVLRVDSVTRSGIADCSDANWGNPSTEPTIITGCAFQETSATGTTETLRLQCLKDGRSALHLVTPSEDEIRGSGLFDFNGLPIPTDLVDAEVTCGAGGPLATVPIPTNPTGSQVATAIAGGVPTAGPSGTAGSPAAQPGTPESATSPGAQPGTPGSAASPGAQPGTPGSASSAAAKTGTPKAASSAAAKTGTPGSASGASTGSGGSSSGRNWLIAIIVVGVLLAAGAAGAVTMWRRRASSGG